MSSISLLSGRCLEFFSWFIWTLCALWYWEKLLIWRNLSLFLPWELCCLFFMDHLKFLAELVQMEMSSVVICPRMVLSHTQIWEIILWSTGFLFAGYFLLVLWMYHSCLLTMILHACRDSFEKSHVNFRLFFLYLRLWFCLAVLSCLSPFCFCILIIVCLFCLSSLCFVLFGLLNKCSLPWTGIPLPLIFLAFPRPECPVS